MIKYRCPECNQKLGVPDEYAGKRVRCNKCNQPSIVPKAVNNISVANQAVNPIIRETETKEKKNELRPLPGQRTNMLVVSSLFYIALLGLLISSVLHFSSMFGILNIPKVLSKLLYVGAWLLFLPAASFQQRMRKDLRKEGFRKLMLEIYPNWILVTTGLILFYVIGSTVFIIILVRRTGVENAGNFVKSFPSVPMAIFALAANLLYGYRRWSKTVK